MRSDKKLKLKQKEFPEIIRLLITDSMRDYPLAVGNPI